MKDLKQDQHEFMSHSSSPMRPPKSLMDQVRSDLDVSATQVFTKLSGIHLLSSLLTLSVCPQFGVRAIGEGMGLMHAFMAFGTYGCMVACGAFFLGVAFILAGLLLKGEELRLLRKHRWLGLSAVTALSLGFFIMLDAEVMLGLAIAWFIGAVLGGLAMLELTWAWRFRPYH